MVALITLSLLMGSAIYLLLILALDPESPVNHPGVYNFVMGACSLKITLLSNIQEYIQWVSALFMAYKYHQVARQLSQV